MTTLTNGTATITPALVLGWETHRTSRTVVHDVLSRPDPDVVLRPASTRAGTLRLFFLTPEEAHECEQMHAAPGVWDIYTGGMPTEVRRNLFPNPSFETGSASVSSGGGLTVLTTNASGFVSSGARALRMDVVGATAANPYVFQTTETFPADSTGHWLAVGMRARRGAGDVTAAMQRIAFYSGTTGVTGWINSPGAALPAVTMSAVPARLHAAQIPAAVDRARIALWFSGSTTSFTAPGDGSAYTDDWIACVAPTEAEARASVATYFDGDVSPDPALVPSWLGDPGLSASVLTYTPPSPAPGGTMRYVVGGGDLRVTSDGPDHARWVVEVPFREVAL